MIAIYFLGLLAFCFGLFDLETTIIYLLLLSTFDSFRSYLERKVTDKALLATKSQILALHKNHGDIIQILLDMSKTQTAQQHLLLLLAENEEYIKGEGNKN